MKKLEECKEYFQDVFTNCLAEGTLNESIFDSTEKAQYETLCDALRFIYGAQFEKVKPYWINEALNEFYGK